MTFVTQAGNEPPKIATTTDTGTLDLIPTRLNELRYEGLLTIHRVEYSVSGFASWAQPHDHDDTGENGEWIVTSVYATRPWGDFKGGQHATPAAIKVLQAELPDVIKYAVAEHTELFYAAEEERRRIDKDSLQRQLKEKQEHVDLLTAELHKLKSGQEYTTYPIPDHR